MGPKTVASLLRLRLRTTFVFVFAFFFFFTRLWHLWLLFMHYAWTIVVKFDFSYFFFSQSVHTVQLFIDPQISLFSNFFIKNGPHCTIHTFKNYFTIIFFNFQFQFSVISKRTLNATHLKSHKSWTPSTLWLQHDNIPGDDMALHQYLDLLTSSTLNEQRVRVPFHVSIYQLYTYGWWAWFLSWKKKVNILFWKKIYISYAFYICMDFT